MPFAGAHKLALQMLALPCAVEVKPQQLKTRAVLRGVYRLLKAATADVPLHTSKAPVLVRYSGYH